MRNKKILFICQYFYPELFRGNDIAFDWAKYGNEVTVICGTPNYPKGKFFEGYGWFKKRHENINGVNVRRLPIIPRGNGGALMLMLNYFSYLILASIYVLLLALFGEKRDLVFVQQLSPVVMSFPGVIYKKVKRVPLYTWILDLWPESLQSAGGINNKYILGFFDWFVKKEYEHSTKILISSKNFRQSIASKGGYYKDKIIYYPQWAEDVFVKNNSAKMEELRAKLPSLPSGFKVMFAGNIGEAQDFDHIMKTALSLKNENDIHFIFVGDGRKKPWVENFIRENELEDTVHCVGRYPVEMMPVFFEQANAMLVTLKNEPIFKLTAPAKIQAYMASKKMIIGMLSGEGKNLIEDAKCGFVAEAADYEALRCYIHEAKNLNQAERNEMAQNGYNFFLEHFDKAKALENLNNIISNHLSCCARLY